MITRFPGLTPTRSRAVVHDDLVMTVAVAPDPVTSSMYEQSARALARIDESLALCGSAQDPVGELRDVADWLVGRDSYRDHRRRGEIELLDRGLQNGSR